MSHPGHGLAISGGAVGKSKPLLGAAELGDLVLKSQKINFGY